MNRDAMMTGLHISSAADKADPNAWAYTLDHWSMLISILVTAKIKSITLPWGQTSLVIKIRRKNLQSLIQLEAKSAIETVQRLEMRSLSRNLVEKIVCDAFITRYCAATDSIKDSYFSFVKSIVSEIIHRGVLDETLNRSCNR